MPLDLIVGFFCFLIGLTLGSWGEHKWGIAQRDATRYHKIIMRMIPYLRQHLTSEFIYGELIRGYDYEVGTNENLD